MRRVAIGLLAVAVPLACSGSGSGPDADDDVDLDADADSAGDGDADTDEDPDEVEAHRLDDCHDPYVVPIGPDLPHHAVPVNLVPLAADVDLTCGGGTGPDGLFVLDPPEPVHVQVCVVQVSLPFPLHYEIARGPCGEPTEASSLACELSDTSWSGPSDPVNCTRVRLDGMATVVVKADQSDGVAPVLVDLEAFSEVEPVVVLPERASGLSFGPAQSEDRVLLASGDGGLVIWRGPASGQPATDWDELLRADRFSRVLAFAPDGSAVAVGSQATRTASIQPPDPEALPTYFNVADEDFAGTDAVAWSPGSDLVAYLVSAAGSQRLRLTDPALPAEPVLVERLADECACFPVMVWLPEGETIVVAIRREIQWRSALDGGLTDAAEAAHEVRAISPDGTHMVGNAYAAAPLLDGRGEVELELPYPGGFTLDDAEFSPNGECVALLGNEGDVVVSGLEGNEVARFRAESEASWAVAWSPDGRLLAVSYEEGINIWQVGTAACAGS